MKPYSAKENQICFICHENFTYDGKNGFATHLKQHSITMEKYLLENYYSDKDLKCQNEKCKNKVKLRKHIPKTLCEECLKGKNYIKKPRERKCLNCDMIFSNKDLRIKTCSKKCSLELKSKKVKAWHANMSKEEKKDRFERIIEKTASTRRKNHTPSWNSGKTGIYSEETIQKIREATIKQLENCNGVFKKTNIEHIMDDLLNEMGFNYKYSFILKWRQYDFIIYDYDILIECDGDFWHGNPKFYPVPSEFQKERNKLDKIKTKIAKENGYTILRFWENDILHNLSEVKEKIKSTVYDLLTTT